MRLKLWHVLATLGGLYLMNKTAGIITPYNEAIERISREYGNDPALVKAIIRVESNFREKANLKTAVEDSRGLGQINTLQTGVLRNLGIDASRLYEPEYNIAAVNRFLNDIKKRYRNVLDIMAAYNAGSARRSASGEYVNQAYVDKVSRFYDLYRGFSV